MIRFHDVLARRRHRRRDAAAARRNRDEADRCFYCHVSFEGDGRATRTVDHRLARSRGGTDGLANLVFACRACNARKADQVEEVFAASGWLAARRLAVAGVAPRSHGDEDATVADDVDEAAVAGAMAVTDGFLATFNAGDARAHAETLGYPHVRLASGQVRIWEHLEEGATAMEQAIPLLRERTGWDHSEWDHRRVIHTGPGKVHLDVQFTRYRADGSVVGVYPAVYVVVEGDAGWRIQCRSSFAP